MKRIGVVTIACLMLLLSSQTHALNEKVLFFEAGLATADTIFSEEATGYSKLSAALRAEGMLVASMSSGVINREFLAPYDIVVLHPSPERPLEEREISALVWFVAQQGGALFVHGGPPKVVNPLTEVFGISMDTGKLIDTSSALSAGADGHMFVLSRFPQGADFGFSDVDEIGFYGGPPLVLSEDALAIVTGDKDCYSSNGRYSIGSFPPVAAIAYMGRGVTLVKSDRAMANNANIGALQNEDWAKSVFRQLASARQTVSQRTQSLYGLRSRATNLEQTLKVTTEQLAKYEQDLEASYKRNKELQAKNEGLEAENTDLREQLRKARAERDQVKETLAQYRSPETLKIIAIAGGIVLLVIFVIGLLLGRKTVRRRA